jgi:hypothetical protein
MRKSVLLAAACVLTALGFAPPARAQAPAVTPAPTAANRPNVDKYCNDLYGAQSSAQVLRPGEAGWGCTKGNQIVAIDMDDLCARQSGPNRTGVANNPADPKSWTCVGRDHEIAGVIPPERLEADMERAAKSMIAAGKTPGFCRKYYLSFATTRAQFEGLAHYTVYLISIWTRNADELPIKRAYIRAGENEIEILKVESLMSEQDAGSPIAQACGTHREDGFYLVPTSAMLHDGVIKLDFAGKITGYNLLGLPSNPVSVRLKTRPWYANATTPGARPDLRALQAFMKERFPRFPVPAALP